MATSPLAFVAYLAAVMAWADGGELTDNENREALP
jgi:hypothetical protein